MLSHRYIISILFAVCSALVARAELPALQSGDLIFQTSLSRQSKVIQLASGSKYSHVGIVEVSEDGGTFVLEAISQVSRTGLREWIDRGSAGKFAVYRIGELNSANASAFIAAAKTYLGRPYDLYFTSKNDQIYCSELVDLAARDVGMKFGRYQKFGTLNVHHKEVLELARARWKGHPLCRTLHSFAACWQRILEDEMITPVSLTEDRHLQQIYSNY